MKPEEKPAFLRALRAKRSTSTPSRPQTDLQLKHYLLASFGIVIPDTQVCPNHTTPFRAFSDAYFARHNVSVWQASRGFGGKSYLLALLGHVEADTLGAEVTILGGSGEQSTRVLEYLQKWSTSEDNITRRTRYRSGGLVTALMASSKSARGPHPQRLRLDEVDEMDIKIFDAAMGQPMSMAGIPKQTVASSTHHYPDATFTEVKKRAKENGWPIYEWCWKETSAEPDGWLTQEEIESKRGEVTASMWCVPSYGLVLDANACPVEIHTQPQCVLSNTGVIQAVRKHWKRTTEGELLLRIKVQGLCDPIRLTPNHVVATSDGEKVAGLLRPYSSRWNKATHRFGSGDVLLSPKRKLLAGGNYELGWFVGLYLAEGTARKDRGSRLYFDLAAHEGSGVLARMRALNLASPYVHKGPGFHAKGPTLRIINTRSQVRLSNQYLRNQLEGFTDVSLTARSKRLRYLPLERETLEGILQGWLFGDGAKVKQGWCGVTYSRDLAWQMNQIATDLGYATGMTRGINQGLSKNVFWHVRVSHMTGRTGQVLDLGQAVGRRIRSIQWENYSGDLHDLEVNNDHHYITGGIIVHNSAEYDLQEPSPEGRAILPEKVTLCFRKELGEFTGEAGREIIIEEPEQFAIYAHGCDWAKEKDWTIIDTWRIDCRPMKRVAWLRLGRMPWPMMIRRFNERVAKYGGEACHDKTGVGNMVDDYLTVPAEGIVLTGQQRADVFTDYIALIENGDIVSPLIHYAEAEHRYCTNNDLSGSGHPPDSFVAGAMVRQAAQLKRELSVY